MLSTVARALPILLLTASYAAAAPKVTVRPAPECAARHCHFAAWADLEGDDAARVTVTGITPKPITATYFADYAPGDASLARDAKGVWYVLLPYRIGHGTGPAVISFLAVLRIDGNRLALARRARTRYWTGLNSGAEYDHRVVAKPRQGGLVIRLKRQVWGSDRLADAPPPRVKYLRVR